MIGGGGMNLLIPYLLKNYFIRGCSQKKTAMVSTVSVYAWQVKYCDSHHDVSDNTKFLSQENNLYDNAPPHL